MLKRQIWLAIILVAVLLGSMLSTACIGGKNSSPPASPTTAMSSLTRPQPVVVSVNDTTSGMKDNYYVILAVTIKNIGSAGTVIIDASVTQASQTKTNEMITNLAQNSTQVVDLVFPLVWMGGDWTQTVSVTVP
jgi:hypothetical protein